MVDEDAYRQALRSGNQRPCVFGKAILAACCACPLSDRQAIAEREVIHCSSQPLHEACASLYGLLLGNSQFALRLTHVDAALTHAQNMKVQCGGLHGLQLALDGTEQIADVAALIEAALQAYGSFQELPYSRIVQSVSAFQVRKPHGE